MLGQLGPHRPATLSAGTPTPKAAAMVEVSASSLVGQPVREVVARLERLGLKVRVRWDATDAQRPGRVVSVQPGGRLSPGSVVTVTGALAPAARASAATPGLRRSWAGPPWAGAPGAGRERARLVRAPGPAHPGGQRIARYDRTARRHRQSGAARQSRAVRRPAGHGPAGHGPTRHGPGQRCAERPGRAERTGQARGPGGTTARIRKLTSWAA